MPYSPDARAMAEKTTLATKAQRSLGLNFVGVVLSFPTLDPVLDDLDTFSDMGSKGWRFPACQSSIWRLFKSLSTMLHCNHLVNGGYKGPWLQTCVVFNNLRVHLAHGGI